MPVRKTAKQMPTITSVKRAALGFVMPSLSLAGNTISAYLQCSFEAQAESFVKADEEAA